MLPQHSLITDLALILVLAGITSLLFKWLKQPVVLGYLVAGFLASPHLGLLHSVTEISDISIWAEIGIIVLLFSLGLEFNIKKLATVGKSVFITTGVIIVGMMILGFSVGALLQFSPTDSLFLAAMLSMSSTTIIIKAFNDLGMQRQKFTALVFGILVLEDIVAVLLMVILTSISVNKSFEGGELVFSFLKLVFFLVIWFTLGVFLIPTFLQKTRRYLNSETLLIVSMGLCLGMVVLATYVGFSAALGAFIMGSILAGSIQGERIEKVIRPVKNLFGAVFFISVGMLVDPQILVKYAFPIIVLSVVVIVGQIFFATLGLILSGQSLKTAVQSGFSLAQIGEFAFIIATLGMSLKVIDSFIYPVVVAVSVITTFTTPYFIRLAPGVSDWLEVRLPNSVLLFLGRNSVAKETEKSADWQHELSLFAGKIGLYVILTIGILVIALRYLFPFVREYLPAEWGVHVAAALVVLVLMPLLWAIALKSYKSSALYTLWHENHAKRAFLYLFVGIRILIALTLLSYLLMQIYSPLWGALAALLTFTFFMLLFGKKMQLGAHFIESVFLDNLNERELRKTGAKKSLVRTIHLAQMKVSAYSPFAGERISDIDVGKNYGVSVVSIRRDKRRIDLPSATMRLLPKDVLTVVGTNEQLVQFLALVEPTLIGEEEEDAVESNEALTLQKMDLQENSSWIGKPLKETPIRRKGCLVVGIERCDGSFVEPGGMVPILPGDKVWLVGEASVVKELFQ